MLDDAKLNRNYYWIGGTRAAPLGAINWITGENSDYTNWNHWDQFGTEIYEPNDQPGWDYIGVWNNMSVFPFGFNYSWFNLPMYAHAGFTSGFICEWDA